MKITEVQIEIQCHECKKPFMTKVTRTTPIIAGIGGRPRKKGTFRRRLVRKCPKKKCGAINEVIIDERGNVIE